jgi:polyribonucleotide 5'-hydroxyl-kinase
MSTPLMYYFGHTNPAENIPLYKHYLTNLAQKIDLRQENDPNSSSSGLIVSTSGWIDGPGYDLLLDAIRLYSIDIIIVIGHDRLYSLLSAHSASTSADPSNPITIIKLPKSGGTVYRSDSDRRRLRRSKITEYFYGKRSPSDMMTSLNSLTAAAATSSSSLQSQIESLPNRYSPSRIDLSLKNYTLLKPGGIQLPQSMMPLGQVMEQKSTNLSELKLVSCPLSIDLEHTVIAVLQGTNTLHGATAATPTLVTLAALNDTASLAEGDPLQLLLSANLAGFICVVKIDLEHDILTVLSPCPGHLPSTNLLVGSIKWVE